MKIKKTALLEDNHTQDYRKIEWAKKNQEAILIGNYVRVWDCLTKEGLYYPQVISKELNITRATVYKYLNKMIKNEIIRKVIPSDVKTGKVIVTNKVKEFLEQKDYNDSIRIYITSWRDAKNQAKEEIRLEEDYKELGRLDLPQYVILGMMLILFISNFITLLLLPNIINLIINNSILGLLMIYGYKKRKVHT